MDEQLQFPGQEPEFLERAEIIAYDALTEVTVRFGCGIPNTGFIAGEAELAYHNMQHTMDVMDATRQITHELGLSPHDQAVALMAAAAHDVVQLQPRGVMERGSAAWLAARMIEAGFDKADITAAELAILGTEPLISQDGLMVGQRMELQEYPSQAAALIAASVACADMAELFSAWGPLRGRQLYQELRDTDAPEEPPFNGLKASQRIELELLQNYRFPHPIGEVLFGGLRQEVIDHQVAITQDLFLGRIATWDELLGRDTAFASRYAQ